MQSISAIQLTRYVTKIFRAYKLSPSHAAICATHIVTNDQRGITTHGIRRLPNYLDRIHAGAIDPQARVSTIHRRGATALLDGHHAMGQVTATTATRTLIRLATRSGIACVGVQRCEHVGALDAYIRTIVAHHLVGIIMCNSPVAMAPLGGTHALIGSNPIAIGIPGRTAPLMIFDGSTAATSRGKILAALEEQRPLPVGMAVDATGLPTTDAAKALAGAILPAGALGYGLGIGISMLTGALIGGIADANLPSFFEKPYQPTPTSMLLIAINPAHFGGITQLEAVASAWVTQIRQSHGAPRIPGDRRQLREHITLPASLMAQLTQYATTKGISLW